MWRLYVLNYVAYVYYVFQGCLNNGVNMYYPVWKKHNLLIRTDHLQMFIMTVVWTSLNYMIKYSLFIHVTQRLTCSELTTVRVDTRLFKRIPVIFKALFCVSDHHSFFNDFFCVHNSDLQIFEGLTLIATDTCSCSSSYRGPSLCLIFKLHRKKNCSQL